MRSVRGAGRRRPRMLALLPRGPSMKSLRSSTRLLTLPVAAPSPAVALLRPFTSTSISLKPKSVPSTTSPTASKGKEPRFNYVANPFDSTPDPDVASYRMVTAKELANRKTPPRRVKMLARDFIDDCLYNPHYGYFSTQAVIFDPDEVPGKGKKTGGALASRAEGFDFGKMRNTPEFEDEIARRYGEFEGTAGGVGKGPGRQVWHTPTELFKVSVAVFLVCGLLEGRS